MKSLVVFKSHSGFTRRYAEMIAEELGADLADLKTLNKKDPASYDVLIFGGSLHAVGISGFKQFKTAAAGAAAGDKPIIVFAVGASPASEKIINEITAGNFSVEERKRYRFFYLRGGFDFRGLDLPHKIIMTLFKWKLSRMKDKPEDVKGMIDAYSNPADFVEKENIMELTNYVRGLG